MDPLQVGVLAIGVSLAALVLAGQRSLRTEFRDRFEVLRDENAKLRTELREGLAAASVERQAIRQDVQSLAERVARLEGAIPFLSRRRENSPPPASAA